MAGLRGLLGIKRGGIVAGRGERGRERRAMLELKKWTENDFAHYSRLGFNERTMGMNLGRVFTDEEAALFFQAILRCNRENTDLGYYQVFAKRGEDSPYIGMGALNRNDDDRVLEIEYMLLPQYWHQGYGTELVRKLLSIANESYREMDVVAVTAPENIYSKKLLRRAGFTLDRQYINEDGEPAERYIKRADQAG